MNKKLKQLDIKLLADAGYPISNLNLVTPDKFKSVTWNNQQKGLRSIVEKSIGFAKSWGVLSGKFSGGLIFHQISILLCYQLTQLHHFPN